MAHSRDKIKVRWTASVANHHVRKVALQPDMMRPVHQIVSWSDWTGSKALEKSENINLCFVVGDGIHQIIVSLIRELRRVQAVS